LSMRQGLILAIHGIHDATNLGLPF